MFYDYLGMIGDLRATPLFRPGNNASNNPNLALITNLMVSGPSPYWIGYWSGTLKSDTPFWTEPDGAWIMLTGGLEAPGLQALLDKENVLVPMSMYAWAVRDGDVAAAVAPEPATLSLLGIGVVGAMLRRRAAVRIE